MDLIRPELGCDSSLQQVKYFSQEAVQQMWNEHWDSDCPNLDMIGLRLSETVFLGTPSLFVLSGSLFA